MNAIERACDTAGGQAALAIAIGVSPQFINQIINKKRPLPAEHVLGIERATGGKVTRHELRPDLYPIDQGLATKKPRSSRRKKRSDVVESARG